MQNEGPALARGVNVELEERPETPAVGLDDLPIDLQPGQSRNFPIWMAMGRTPTIQITVRWADEAGDHSEWYTLQVM